MELDVQESGEDKKLIPLQRHWIYTPFQHSESVSDQKVMPCLTKVDACTQALLPELYGYDLVQLL